MNSDYKVVIADSDAYFEVKYKAQYKIVKEKLEDRYNRCITLDVAHVK